MIKVIYIKEGFDRVAYHVATHQIPQALLYTIYLVFIVDYLF